MDKVTVAKEIGKFVVDVGTSAILGGLGGIASAGLKAGVFTSFKKFCIPVATSVWSMVLRKHSDPVVEETVDGVAKFVEKVKPAANTVVYDFRKEE